MTHKWLTESDIEYLESRLDKSESVDIAVRSISVKSLIADWREMRELLAQAQWQGYPPPIATREMLEATADD